MAPISDTGGTRQMRGWWKWIVLVGILFVLLIDGLTWVHLAAAEKVRIQRLEQTREAVRILLEESELQEGDPDYVTQWTGED